MIEVLLIRPGSTTFDGEGRIKGSLDIPLSPEGEQQAEALSRGLAEVKMDCLYVAPCESALASAQRIGDRNFCKQKTLDCLRNLDHGLWQGKLVSEVRRLQPRVYRQFQEHPTDVCPPEGETVQAAYERVKSMVEKLKKRHNGGRIGLLVPAPMSAIVRCALVGGCLGDLWKSELDFGTFEVLQVEPKPAVAHLSLLAVV
jgi:probable phosphoglycerate mutase